MGVGAEEGPELLGLHRGLVPPWSPLDDAASRSTSRITMPIVMAAIDLGVGLLLLSFVCLLRDDHTLLVAAPPLRLHERLMIMIVMLVNVLLLGGIGIGLSQPLQGVHLIVQSGHASGVRARCVPGPLPLLGLGVFEQGGDGRHLRRALARDDARRHRGQLLQLRRQLAGVVGHAAAECRVARVLP